MIRISELQMKEIINVSDGKRLGNIGDIEIDMNTGKIGSIIISKQARMLGIFGKDVEIVIPWEEIMKIGEDVILVRVNPVNSVTESIQTSTIS
ncbi:YlmC/YmxH family sporulation protein [Bacillus wiedmannii]|uniref:YlmC/YmxH family sporulation protein n=1 Tax=Bacillus wiedmannii TaxID=1890302 RepID=UPI0036498888